MVDNKTSSISRSMETQPEFLPYLPELLKDMWALGSCPELIIDIISPLNLPGQKSTVLDLGCGKGAVGILLAKKYGFQVTGIDASSAFLEVARQKAVEHQVSGLCTFKEYDIFEYVKIDRNFNFVVYASLGNMLGSFKEIMSNLRRMVTPGGYIIIDDGYLKGTNPIQRTGYEHYLQYQDTVDELQLWGDQLIDERSTEKESRRINDEYLETLRQSQKDFNIKYPDMTSALNRYIKTQKEECEILDKYICGAVWLLKKR